MSFYRVGDTGILFSPTGPMSVAFAPAAPGITPLPLNQRLIVSGHSILDNLMGGGSPALDAAITAMGGTPQTWNGTGPAADAGFRWVDDPAFPDKVRQLMETPGAAYDAFIGIEAYGGSYEEGRQSVREHVTWSDADGYGVLWTNLAASTGAKTFYGNFWRDAIPTGAPVFDAAWRAAQNQEKPYWDALIDAINAARNPVYPVVRLVPFLEVFTAVYDAIQAGTVTGVTMGSFFSDNVHPSTPAGRWLQVATALAVVYHRHPDELPANVGAAITVSSGLAAQLRPIVWATCLATARTGLGV